MPFIDILSLDFPELNGTSRFARFFVVVVFTPIDFFYFFPCRHRNSLENVAYAIDDVSIFHGEIRECPY